MADVPSESSVERDAAGGSEKRTAADATGQESAGETAGKQFSEDASSVDETAVDSAIRSNGDGPRVVGADSDAAEDLLGVLSSETALAVLRAVHDEPATASGLADRLDASLQTIHYHLGNLDDAGVVEVDGTTTSERGREMDVYAPTAGPVVVFAGQADGGTELRDALQRLVGAFGFLALVSLLVQEVIGGGVRRLWEPSGPSPDGVSVAETTREAAGIEPGLAFFAGGAVVLLVGFALWYRFRDGD